MYMYFSRLLPLTYMYMYMYKPEYKYSLAFSAHFGPMFFCGLTHFSRLISFSSNDLIYYTCNFNINLPNVEVNLRDFRPLQKPNFNLPRISRIRKVEILRPTSTSQELSPSPRAALLAPWALLYSISNHGNNIST